MWFTRVWFLLALCALAVGLSGALTLPGLRDADLAERRAAMAAVEAALIRSAVSAEVAEVRRGAQLAAGDPGLQRTLAALVSDMPASARRALVERELARLVDRTPRLAFVLVDQAGAVLGASDSVAAAADRLATAPIVRAAKAGQSPMAISGDPPRALLATPVPGPEGDRGVLLAVTRPPTAAGLAAHAALGTDAQLVALLAEKPVAGSLPEADWATAATIKATAPAALVLGDATWRARRVPLPAAPGAAVVLVTPVAPPTTLADAGGLGAILSRALERPTETGALLGAAFLVWLLGVLAAGSARRATVRRAAAQVEMIAAGPELVAVEPGQVPGWLWPLVDAANEAAVEARRSAPRLEASAGLSTEVSAERVLEQLEAEERPASSAPPQPSPEPSAPPPDLEPSAPPAPSEPPEHFLASTPPEVMAERTDDASFDEGAEGTTELPGRRLGGPARPSRPPVADVPTHDLERPPAARLFEPEPQHEDAVSTLDRQPGRSSAPPALEDAEQSGDEPDSSVFDLSVSEMSVGRLAEVAEPADLDAEESTDGSLHLPRAPKPASLLDQLKSRHALDPEHHDLLRRSGESTVVRPIPMALLDATAQRDPDRTAVGPPPERPEERDLLERYYEQVFEEFIAIKGACNEPTHGVDYARFRAKLVRTRRSLMERFDCPDVRFRVYVKDGRAALKAAPVLDDEPTLS